MSISIRSVGLTVLLAAVVTPATVPAMADEYPVKSLRLISPNPPGGGVDAAARLVAQRFREVFGQTAVVDNRPGAGGTIGADLLAKSAPDGYTLLLTNSGFAINQSLYKKLPYDGLRDITQIALIGFTTNVLVINPGVKARGVSELIRMLKDKPKGYSYGSAGSGSLSHLAMAYFMLESGAQVVHVPYKGGAPAVVDLIGGQTQVMISTPNLVVPHFATKRLVGLATTGATRSAFLPEMPTLVESGLTNYQFESWYGLHVPAGTPKAVITKLNKAIVSGLETPEVKQQLARLGIEVAAPTSPEAFVKIVRSDVEKMRRIVIASGARAE